MSNRIILAAALTLATSAAAIAGPVATGNAAGGAITVVTPVPLLPLEAEAAAPVEAAPAPVAATPASRPAMSGFIAGYVASFGG